MTQETVRVTVFGGGQLGRMLAEAGKKMNVTVTCLDRQPDACAGQICELIHGDYSDDGPVKQALRGARVATAEFESIPMTAFTAAQAYGVPVHPSITAFSIGRDRLSEKRFARSHEIPTAPFQAINDSDDLSRALTRIGLPGIIKRRHGGYDGKGQWQAKSVQEAERACREAGWSDLILEKWVNFKAECSIVAARNASGEIRTYPLTYNEHRNGILWISSADPQRATQQHDEAAQRIAQQMLRGLEYVGVLAVEFFVTEGDELIFNEFVPRVHNSGHWTIEGAETSQFENHLRAILGEPLGSTETRGWCGMINLIGHIPPEHVVKEIDPEAHIHVYGKEVRPGREVGHITICKQTAEERERVLQRLRWECGPR